MKYYQETLHIFSEQIFITKLKTKLDTYIYLLNLNALTKVLCFSKKKTLKDKTVSFYFISAFFKNLKINGFSISSLSYLI